MDIAARLSAILGEPPKIGEEMKAHTTFQIGGKADFFAEPCDTDALVCAVRLCVETDTPYFILGEGSNVLFGDKGFRGAVLSTARLTRCAITADGFLLAECGAPLKDVCDFALAHSLTGLEFACGIPGSIGGAAFMNAGAYDGEMSRVIAYVTTLTPDGSVRQITAADMDFGYRQSVLQHEGYVALSIALCLQPGAQTAIQMRMRELTAQREEKQPLSMPSAGSTFKRPEGYFAGKLIMDAGLRGYRIGGAQVSEKHCGFVVNAGNATAADVLKLIKHVQDTVYHTSSVLLSPEVRLVGEL